MRRPPSDIRKGTTPTLRLVPKAPMTAPEAVIYAADETVLGTPPATPSAVSTTVASDATNTRARFKLTSTTGVARGLTLQVTDPSWGAADAVVSGVEDSFVRLVQPLPGEPAAGSAVVGLDVLVQLPSTATEDLAKAVVLEVTDGDAIVRHVFSVVRYPIDGPCTTRDIRAAISQKQAQIPIDDQACEDLAHEVNRQVRAALLESHHYVSHYWDPSSLQDLQQPFIDMVLLDKLGLRDAASTQEVYLERLEKKADRLAGRLRRSAEPHDVDGDGELTPEEVAPSWSSRMER